jgi:hypothetical protein
MLLYVACGSAFAGNAKEFIKTIEKEFSINSDGMVTINNKYGNVEIVGWEQNKVNIKVTITADTKNQSTADELFDRIIINFSNTSSSVKADTEIKSKASWTKFWGKNKNDFKIDYLVQMPKSNELNLENKYGDIYVTTMDNRADVTLKYGNLRMDGVNGDIDLMMGYSKGSLSSAHDVELVLNYSTLRLGTAEDMHVKSKYSTLEIESAAELRSESSYDNYRVNQVKEFKNFGKYDDLILEDVHDMTVETKYSDIVTKQLTGSADMDTRYGGVDIKHIARGFDEIYCSGNYTKVNLEFAENASFSVDAYTKYAPIKYTDLNLSVDKKQNNEKEIQGVRGGSDGGRVKVNLNYGSLTIH